MMQKYLNYYQDRFRYIMVDEYQDTNTSQFKLDVVCLQQSMVICVLLVMMTSQYISSEELILRNILNFENTFEGTKVIKLEQNYRSTQTILNAANAVITE